MKYFFVLSSALFLLSGCVATLPAVNFEDAAIDQVWPASPEVPRIRLLRLLNGAEDMAGKDAKENRIVRWLTGESGEQMPMVAPYGIATNGEGLLWITDPGSHAVHMFDLLARKSGVWTLAGDRSFANPTGICFDAARQRIYVADSLDKRVVALSTQGKFILKMEPDQPWGRPGGLALDSRGNLLVADVLLGKIRRFTPEGKELSAFGSPTTPGGLFNRPIAVATDQADRIYVIDSLNFRIEVLAADGSAVATIGQLGDSPGSLSRPRGLAVDKHGHIYVADAAFDNIQIFNRQGQLLMFFGGAGKYGLSLPAGLVVDARDRIYAVDSFNHRVQIYQLLEGPD